VEDCFFALYIEVVGLKCTD